MAHMHFEIWPIDVSDPDAVANVVRKLRGFAEEGQTRRVARGDLEVTADVIEALAAQVFAPAVEDDFPVVEPDVVDEELESEGGDPEDA